MLRAARVGRAATRPLVRRLSQTHTVAPGAPVGAPATAAEPGTKSTADKVVTLLEDHGGKIALATVGVIAGLIYRYFQGVQNRNAVEKDVEHATRLEPYEIQMLRTANGYSLELYKEMIEEIKRKELSWSSSMTYKDLVALMDRTLSTGRGPRGLKLGYLLDRVVQGAAEQQAAKGNAFATSGDEFYQQPMLVPFFVSLMALPMENEVDRRIEGLFYACTSLSGGSSDRLSRDSVASVIQSLADTDQIPIEKQVEETGEKYPIYKHRRKSPHSMISSYEEQSLKLKQPKEDFDLRDFQHVLTSRFICTWGSCYRKKSP